MLTVKSADFYENYSTRPDGTPVFSGKYSELYFDEYPVTTDIDTLAIDFHAVGELEGFFLIRVWQGEELIHETALTSIHGLDRGGGGEFGFISGLQGITFPRPGNYRFDIVFNDSILHSTPLCLIQPAPHKTRKRHK